MAKNELKFTFLGNTKPLQGDMKKLEKQTFSTSKIMTTAFIAIGAIGVASLAKEIIKLSSDFEETDSKFKQVFKDIAKSAEEASKSLQESFGLSSLTAKTLLADTGDLLTGFGFSGAAALGLSKQVQELSVDLASFTNFSGGAEGASKALTKALLGERESVKALGIAILESDVKAKIKALEITGKFTSETLREKRAIATLEIALEQSKNAIGDYGRTSDSVANQTRLLSENIIDLKIEIGNELLPAFNDIVNSLVKITAEEDRVSSGAITLGKAFNFIADLLLQIGHIFNQTVKSIDFFFFAIKEGFIAIGGGFVDFKNKVLNVVDLFKIAGLEAKKAISFNVINDEAIQSEIDLIETKRILRLQERDQKKREHKEEVVRIGKEKLDRVGLAEQEHIEEIARRLRHRKAREVARLEEHNKELVDLKTLEEAKAEQAIIAEEERLGLDAERRVIWNEIQDARDEEDLQRIIDRLENEKKWTKDDLKIFKDGAEEKLKAIKKANELRIANEQAANNALRILQILGVKDSSAAAKALQTISSGVAIFKTYEAANKSFAEHGGFPTGIPPMLASIAQGLANVSLLNSASFAVGTDFVPHDMTANIHRGEGIIPARAKPKYNSGNIRKVLL